jgi:hypothetical protein
MSNRLNTWSAMKLATGGAKFAGIPMGKAARVSTGEPKVTMLASDFERR